MLYINHDLYRTSQLAEEWLDRLTTFLTETGKSYSVSYPDPSNPNEKLKVPCDSYKQKMITTVDYSNLNAGDRTLAKAYINLYIRKLRFFVLAEEKEMEFIKYLCVRCKKYHPLVFDVLAEIAIKLYETFVDKVLDDLSVPISYHFIEQMNVRTCPYCNRIYTLNIYSKNGKKARPEYDHFYDKADNPFLAVSYYNLVPSCPICNHIKSTDSLRINPHFHRYEGVFRVLERKEEAERLGHGQLQELNRLQLFNQTEWGDISLTNASDDEQNDMHTLGLDELYKKHDDYAREIVEKAQAYSGPVMSALSSTFQGPGYSPRQVYDFVWGKELETARQINRPLSKLTRDLLEQVGVMDNE